MNPIVRTGASLLIIAGVAAAALGCVNSATAPIIKDKSEQSEQTAMKAVFLPTTASVDEISALPVTFEPTVKVDDSMSYSKASNGGYAFSITTKGFSAGLKLMIGIDADGTVTGVKVVSHSETPGLGGDASKVLSPQFDNGKKAPLAVVKNIKPADAGESELAAITGATITSNAVKDAVNTAVEYYEANLKGGNS